MGSRKQRKLTVPFKHVRRSEFSAATLQLRSFGDGFERVPQFDVNIKQDGFEAVLDIAALKMPAGDFAVAFFGGAVASYRYCPEAIPIAEAAQRKAESNASAIAEELKKLEMQLTSTEAAESKAALQTMIAELKTKHQAAVAAVGAATEKAKQATQRAQPRDIVDIVVSEPIAVRVKPAEAK